MYVFISVLSIVWTVKRQRFFFEGKKVLGWNTVDWMLANILAVPLDSKLGYYHVLTIKNTSHFNRPFLLSQPAFDDNVLNKSLCGVCSLVLDYWALLMKWTLIQCETQHNLYKRRLWNRSEVRSDLPLLELNIVIFC